jgi:UDP-2-acetamido-2,6-beta-L-arabino-hexul-4-ose reductase
MTHVLVTGAQGFIGRNLRARLEALGGFEIFGCDIQTPEDKYRLALGKAEVIYHLAGVNRPERVEEYDSGNHGFTAAMCAELLRLGRAPKIVFSSSIQAALDNPYGRSKRQAEEALIAFAETSGAAVAIYRLPNVFGKWCRPNYNSVVATFCHNIANDLPISISDPTREIELVYVDDVADAFMAELSNGCGPIRALPTCTITLGDLAARIQVFHAAHTNLLTPDFAVRFNQQLCATYLSYIPAERRRQQLQPKRDARGELAEFIKSPNFGQIFVSRTKPGITRGNHFHHTKTEKFFVVQGEGIIRMRHIELAEVVEYRVRGEDFQVIDIPPGFTHSIENVGSGELVTLFWASEIFDPDRPDTYFLPVLAPAQSPVPVTA